MKLQLDTLDGHRIDHKIVGNISDQKSKLHLMARSLIKEIYPLSLVYEEVRVPIYKRKYLVFDFFLPQFYIFIEIQGEQHEKYVSYFHKSKEGWAKASTRDKAKAEWAALNNFLLIEFKHNESIEEWCKKIK